MRTYLFCLFFTFCCILKLAPFYPKFFTANHKRQACKIRGTTREIFSFSSKANFQAKIFTVYRVPSILSFSRQGLDGSIKTFLLTKIWILLLFSSKKETGSIQFFGIHFSWNSTSGPCIFLQWRRYRQVRYCDTGDSVRLLYVKPDDGVGFRL